MRMPRRYKRRPLIFFTIMGPGIITASVDQDAGGIATYSVAGARYGYSLLWTIFFTTLSSAVIQEMGERMAVVTVNNPELMGTHVNTPVTRVATPSVNSASMASEPPTCNSSARLCP